MTQYKFLIRLMNKYWKVARFWIELSYSLKNALIWRLRRWIWLSSHQKIEKRRTLSYHTFFQICNLNLRFLVFKIWLPMTFKPQNMASRSTSDHFDSIFHSPRNKPNMNLIFSQGGLIYICIVLCIHRERILKKKEKLEFVQKMYIKKKYENKRNNILQIWGFALFST